MDILPPIVLQIVLILLSAFFTTAKVAVVSINDTKLATLASKGDKRARRISKLTDKPTKFLSVIRSVTMFLAMLSGAYAAYSFGSRLAYTIYDLKPSLFEHINAQRLLIHGSMLVCVICFSLLMYIFGYAVPKRLASKKAEDLALRMSSSIVFFVALATPLSALENGISNLILKMFGTSTHDEEEQVTEEEIRIMVDVGSENGTIDESEKEMIQNVFEFDNLTAGDVATHRTDITMLWLEENEEKWDEIITGTSFSRYPVCDESADKIVGVLSTRDYLTLEDKSRESVLKNAVKPAYFVPESVKADVLFKNMKERKEFFAVVLDEYGGTAGIVTINDLLEQLVGEFNTQEEDEENEVPPIQQIEDERWIIQGDTPMEDVIEAIGEGIIEEDSDADTASGYALGLYGTIPTDGSSFEVETDTLVIKVVSVKDHVAQSMELFIKPPVTEEEEENSPAKNENL